MSDDPGFSIYFHKSLNEFPLHVNDSCLALLSRGFLALAFIGFLRETHGL